MGQVYRAHDERLHRPVAVKILPAAFASDADRLRRFEQEARLAGSLSHPNVMVVYDVGRYENRPFIVEELLEGQTLRDRMRGRFFSPQRAVEIAVEIAEGLAAAHAKGIVHRDLKPSNVFLSKDGQTKILDFGLAKLRDPQTLDGEPDTGSTTEGLLGTVGYLSPEQARGDHADHRADIFALGCVLYEMLTGRKAFAGSSVAEILAATLSRDPPSVSRVTPEVPSSLSRIVRRCLEKETEDRFSSAHDLSIALESTLDHLGPAPWWRRSLYLDRKTRRLIRAGIAGVALAAVAFYVVGTWQRSPLPDFKPRQLTSGLGLEAQPAVSPNGQFVAYVETREGNADLWLSDVEDGTRLRLTSHPARDERPAWFPDGRSLAFVSFRDGGPAIWKVSRLGGRPTPLLSPGRDPAISPDGARIAFTRPGPEGAERIHVAPLGNPTEARILTGNRDGLSNHSRPSWSPDGRSICYQGFTHLWLVDPDGATPRRLTDQEETGNEPFWSPDGRHIYYTAYLEGIRAIWRRPVAGGTPVRVTLGLGQERWPSLSGDGRWMAHSTNASREVLVAIDTATGQREVFEEARNLCCPTVSPDGSAVVFASTRDAGAELWTLPLGAQPLTGEPQLVTDQKDPVAVPRFSRDGRWIAFFRKLEGQREIWTVPAAGGAIRRVTFDPAEDVYPLWSPDGIELGFISYRSGVPQIWAVAVRDGAPIGEAHAVLNGSGAVSRFAWSPDGRQVAYVAPLGETHEVWLSDVDSAEGAHPITDGANPEDVRWLVATDQLLVLAHWGTDTLSLRILDPATGVLTPMPAAAASGPASEIQYFDASADGRWIILHEIERRGDIWLLEATKGSF
jgi:Tol biopolymer transport system component